MSFKDAHFWGYKSVQHSWRAIWPYVKDLEILHILQSRSPRESEMGSKNVWNMIVHHSVYYGKKTLYITCLSNNRTTVKQCAFHELLCCY